ncbi:DNA mismatch endonuclease Vsr [Chromobacterium violaceum]|uniref:very short patch repair endonuclease n=1 Tax=Chromobacterium violaceum TaxID=536 RepID=UPI001BE9583A|nr:very short patch repair endonuclease [Chromobacterium violaceum]MBT2865909.1 DNA mismatch endonuclease Vsr [Chromobacterium violaceum]
MDTLSPEARSRVMGRIKSKHTKPEMAVRKIAYGLGYRYRLHGKELPGKPDLVFKGRRQAVFVHGCFWHGHDCGRCRMPKSNQAYWQAKIQANMSRDAAARMRLEEMGWRILEIWECQTRDASLIESMLKNFLG